MNKLITIAKYILVSIVTFSSLLVLSVFFAIIGFYHSDVTAEVKDDNGKVIYTKKYAVKDGIDINISEDAFIINGDTLSNIK